MINISITVHPNSARLGAKEAKNQATSVTKAAYQPAPNCTRFFGRLSSVTKENKGN